MANISMLPNYQFPTSEDADNFLKWCKETYPGVTFAHDTRILFTTCRFISLNPLTVPYNKKGIFFKEVASTYCNYLNKTGQFCPIGKDPKRPSDCWTWSCPFDDRIVFVH